MRKSLKEIADIIGGEVLGDENISVYGVSNIEDAKEGEITFISNPKYLRYLDKTSASAIIVSKNIEYRRKPLIRVDNPYLAYAKVANIFYSKPLIYKGIDSKAFISDSATIGVQATIYPFVYIGDSAVIGERVVLYPFVYIGENVKIGNDSIIYSNVSIYNNCIVGNRVIIHSGTVIGSDGFGYARDRDKSVKIPQIGIVEIGDDVEIGSNVSIDRGAIGKTLIGDGTKIDNLVQIAHNVKIGNNSIIVAQVGISGSTEIGENVTLAGQVGVVGHIKIGNNVTVAAQSGISKDVKDGEVMAGYPAIPIKEWRKAIVEFRQLSNLRKRVESLEKRLKSGGKS
jgi:UDP-3-O-[3-hydroxymyristoyl] glucosamine N-acyltransferase